MFTIAKPLQCPTIQLHQLEQSNTIYGTNHRTRPLSTTILGFRKRYRLVVILRLITIKGTCLAVSWAAPSLVAPRSTARFTPDFIASRRAIEIKFICYCIAEQTGLSEATYTSYINYPPPPHYRILLMVIDKSVSAQGAHSWGLTDTVDHRSDAFTAVNYCNVGQRFELGTRLWIGALENMKF